MGDGAGWGQGFCDILIGEYYCESAMTQLTLSLPDDIQTYIDEQLSQGGYRTAEDFVLQLILQSRTRADAIAEVEIPSALQAFQNAGLVGCVEIEPTESYQSIVQDYVIQKHQHHQL